jgi:hypothetical protein
MNIRFPLPPLRRVIARIEDRRSTREQLECGHVHDTPRHAKQYPYRRCTLCQMPSAGAEAVDVSRAAAANDQGGAS